jgi:membrane protease YdiL (CAAX protease family)
MLNKNSLSVRDWVGGRDENKRVGILSDILIVFAPLLILGGLGEWLGDSTALGALFVNLSYVLSIGAATVVLKSRGRGWRDIGLARPASWPKTILLGFGVAVSALLASVVFQVILQLIPGLEIAPRDQSSYDALVGNLPLLILYLAAAWTIITFGEEMIFRAFLTNSLAAFFPGKKGQWALALIGSSLIFGLIHFSWGLAGVLETTVMGFVFGSAYLLSGRNLWVTIIAHGLANTLGFILIFSGMA